MAQFDYCHGLIRTFNAVVSSGVNNIVTKSSTIDDNFNSINTSV